VRCGIAGMRPPQLAASFLSRVNGTFQLCGDLVRREQLSADSCSRVFVV
jgi:hypothetical protein